MQMMSQLELMQLCIVIERMMLQLELLQLYNIMLMKDACDAVDAVDVVAAVPIMLIKDALDADDVQLELMQLRIVIERCD